MCKPSDLDNYLPYYDKFVLLLFSPAFTGSACGEPFDPEHTAEGLSRVEFTPLNFPKGTLFNRVNRSDSDP
jgi:hypothetical protein